VRRRRRRIITSIISIAHMKRNNDTTQMITIAAVDTVIGGMLVRYMGDCVECDHGCLMGIYD
jgi:hypothetical protein